MTTDAVIPKISPKWEVVCDERRGMHVTRRLVVPGGWLYQVTEYTDVDLTPGVALTFVPKL